MQPHNYPMIHSQRGVVTLAVGILLLLLITLVTLYGARIGLMEQRISGNEYRAKLAHGAAEAGRNNAVEFINANLSVFNTDETVTLEDGSTVQGWLAGGNDRWGNGVAVDCDKNDDGTVTEDEISNYSTAEQIACSAGLDADGAQGVFFYDDPNQAAAAQDMDVFSTSDHTADRVAVNTGKQGDELRVSYNADMVLCPLNMVLVDHDSDASTPEVPRVPAAPEPTCTTEIGDARYYAVLVRSQGYLIDANGDIVGGDIDNSGTVDLDEAAPRSTAQEVVVKYDLFGAGPRVPLTVAASFGSGGTFDIVANPNGGPAAPGGGKSGAPFSVWSPDDYTLAGATVTCQRHEFFAQNASENDTYGDSPPLNQYEVCYKCECPNKQNEQFFYLSSDVKGEGIDIVDEDSDFPDDLFKFTFGIPREDYQILKDLAEPIADCGTLDSTSSGLYWSEGSCEIQNDVGTPHNPVLIVSEGDVTINGGAILFGVAYVFDSPDNPQNPDLSLNGGAQVYGAVVGDSGGGGKGTGGNVIVYDQAVLNRVMLNPDLQRVSPLPGTWSDSAGP